MKIALATLISMVVYMSVWFFVGWRKQRLDVVDTAWGGGFILVALISFLYRQNVRTGLIGCLVLLWGLRLAAHIWRRGGRKGPDPRYVELSDKWNRRHFWLRAYFSIFILQGALILIISLPIGVASSETAGLPASLAIIGTALWVAGFVIESTADSQLGKFVSVDSNKGKVLQTGLWRYSRHPNYFGEITQWWAIGILAIGSGLSWLGLIGPALLTYLIIFVSGLPPIEKRRHNNPAYQDYKRRTSPLVPLPPRRLKHKL